MSATGADGLRRGRIFVLALMALFTAGAAVSVRAVTAVHMQAEYLDPLDPVHAGAMLGTVLGAAFAGFRHHPAAGQFRAGGDRLPPGADRRRRAF